MMSTVKRIAVIDCGTNTFNIKVVDVGASGGWIPVFAQRIPVRLGKGGMTKGAIMPDRMARGLDALASMRESVRNYKVQEVFVVATSAMRDAKNGMEFVRNAKELTGFDIEIISGHHEALLIHEGVMLNIPELPEGPCLTMDIGGGSVEFIVWEGREVLWSRSADAGVARLQMLMQLPDPMGEDGLVRMRPFLDDVLASVAAAMEAHEPRMLVGASGSFDTLADMAGTRVRHVRPDHAQSPEPHPLVDDIPLSTWTRLRQGLIEGDMASRLAMQGMDPARVDLMPYSAALIDWVMNKGTIQSMVRAPYALREGVMSRVERGLGLLP